MEKLETTGAADAVAITEENAVMRKTTKSAKKTKAARAGAVKGKTKAKASAGTKTPRPGSKLDLIVGLLKRPQGCTAAEVLAETGWPSVSMPQQAKAAGLKLTKEGRPARYRAA